MSANLVASLIVFGPTIIGVCIIARRDAIRQRHEARNRAIAAKPLPRRDVLHYQALAREAQAENDRVVLDAVGRWQR